MWFLVWFQVMNNNIEHYELRNVQFDWSEMPGYSEAGDQLKIEWNTNFNSLLETTHEFLVDANAETFSYVPTDDEKSIYQRVNKDSLHTQIIS